jgi:EmrB/QacA subfamily drug resistance transporter
VTAPGVALRSRAGTTAVLAVSAGTTGTFLVSTAVVPALPRLSADLAAGFAGEQWVLSIFAVTLSAFLLLGGALGDRYGRRRVHLAGLGVFLVCSLGCAAAPDLTVLLAARAGQGIGAALLLPTALALLQGAVARADHPALLGRWTALSAVAALLGPFLGGSVIDAVSWRAVFLVPVPFLLVALVAVARVPESAEPGAGPVDLLGGALLAAALGALTYGAISATGAPAAAVVAVLVGLVAAGVFVQRNRRSRAPLLPPDLFADRRLVIGSVLTFVVYLGFNGSLFLNTLLVQRALGYSPFQAAVAFLPVQATVLALAPATAVWTARRGVRAPLLVGLVLCAAGLALLTRIAPGASYVTTLLPGFLVLGVGLALTAGPITALVLDAAPPARVAVANAWDNATARASGLAATAVLPVLVGATTTDAAAFVLGVHRGVWVCVACCLLGALLVAATVDRRRPATRAPAGAPRWLHLDRGLDR